MATAAAPALVYASTGMAGGSGPSLLHTYLCTADSSSITHLGTATLDDRPAAMPMCLALSPADPHALFVATKTQGVVSVRVGGCGDPVVIGSAWAGADHGPSHIAVPM